MDKGYVTTAQDANGRIVMREHSDDLRSALSKHEKAALSRPQNMIATVYFSPTLLQGSSLVAVTRHPRSAA